MAKNLGPAPFRNTCLDCGSGMIGRSVRRVTRTYSTVYFRCSNFVCGASFVAALEITHRLGQSGAAERIQSLPLRTPANDNRTGEPQAAAH